MNRILKIIVSIFLVLFFTIGVNASTLSKGFEALEIHDYFKAKSLFYKTLIKQPAAAAYGLSVIYSRNNNPFYNLDSALHYAKISTNSFWEKTSEKQKLKYKEYDVDTVSVCNQRDVVDEKCFVFANEINTIKGYNHFITNNVGALQIEQAVTNRNVLAYNDAKTTNTSYVYKLFIETYPKAEQINEAKARYDKQLFKEYTIDRTLASNVKFILEQPNSFYVSQAQQNIYELSTKSKTVKAYYDFVKTYPNNLSIPKAWRNIYNLSTQVRTSKNIKRFLNQFPDYPFKEELEQDYALANKKYYHIQKGNKWGFVNEQLKEVIPTIYSWASNFSEGAAAVMLNGKVGFINKNKNTVISFEYDEAEPYVNGLAVVGKNDKYGIINRTGEIIVPTIYDEIGETAHQFISIELNGKYGFIDRKGNLKVGLQYETVGDFNNGIAYVKQNGLFGIIDTNLFYVVKPKYEWIDNLRNDFIRIKENGLYGVVDVSGKYIVQPIYNQLTEVKNGYAMVVKNQLYGYINPNGNVVIDVTLPYSEGVINWGLFNEKGFARIITEENFGLIDTTGNKFMPALFEGVGEVSDNLIAIKRHGKWGYCDYDTKLKIPYNFDYAAGFINDLAFVQTEGKYGLINNKGSYVIEAQYEVMEWFYHQLLLVKSNGLYGLIDLKQTTILPIQYTKIEFTFDKQLLRLYSKSGFEYKTIESVFGE